MIDNIVTLSPIFLLGLIGYFLKKINFFNSSHADLFMKMVFYIAIPGLVFTSFDKIHLDIKLIRLPFFSAFILIFNFVLSYIIGKKLNIQRRTLGTFVLGASILNTGFCLPFIITLLGDEGVSRFIMFDLGNVIPVITILYFFACKMGSNDFNTKTVLKKFVFSTPLIALIIAMIMNVLDLHLPNFLLRLATQIGNMVFPLVLFALGIYFNPKFIHIKLSGIVIFLRMIVGFFVGLIIVYIFNLQDLERIITLVGMSAPVGFNTLTFSSLEGLDKELAAGLLSYSILIGLFSVPFLIFYLL
jgi:predicted permease